MDTKVNINGAHVKSINALCNGTINVMYACKDNNEILSQIILVDMLELAY